jgi:hypothetical protein
MKQNAESATRSKSKMGRKQSIIIASAIAVLSSAACLSIASASIPATTASSVVPKQVVTPKPVTASTAQFSCPNCGSSSSLLNLGATVGLMNTYAKMNFGTDAYHPERNLVAFPTLTSAPVLPVTSVTADDARANQEALLKSGTFDGDGMMVGGSIDPGSFGDWMVEHAGISKDYADEVYGSDEVKGAILKADDYQQPFSAGKVIDNADDS